VLAGEPIVSAMHRRDPAQPVPGGISRTSGVRVFVALPVAAPDGAVTGAVVLSRTPNSLVDTVSGKRYELSVLFLLLIAGGAALAAGIRGWSHELWRWLWPRLRRSRVPMPDHAGTREVAELSDAIASMARTLQTRADYIRSFAASVSHEFKTPMAAIKAAAELLDDHGETISSEERRHLTALVTDGVARLERLVRRLVELARADMMRGGNGGQSVAAVAPVLERVAARFREGGMTVTITGQAGSVGLPEDALDAMLTSILENAAAHAPGAAVQIAMETVDGQARITVKDDGPGIPPSHRERAFEPFFTTARASGGTGLGLPIVRSIASSIGGSVVLAPVTAGAAFVICLPEVA
jgi:signal transduction histidine kinase